jgi:hypothetical protein
MRSPHRRTIVPQQTRHPLQTFCASCGHTEFIHSDSNTRRCWYNECACPSFRLDGERLGDQVPPTRSEDRRSTDPGRASGRTRQGDVLSLRVSLIATKGRNIVRRMQLPRPIADERARDLVRQGWAVRIIADDPAIEDDTWSS